MNDMNVFLLMISTTLILFSSGFYVVSYADKKWKVAVGVAMLVVAALITYGLFTHCNASVVYQRC